MKVISISEALRHARRVYLGVITPEQLMVADVYAELLLSVVDDKDLDELIDCISASQELAKITIRINKINEKFRDNGINDGPVRIEHKRSSHKSVPR